ncbi:hypothetical protein Hamer_G025528 [Homarus americanus]|uniref:Uncharacterized protein n=1 Tax=Homarus americanus TaxID=6706 RepID=A0A8J5NEA7_HOMAM|nr:hypothetical protein Hamer_G025528 [Homarus americanus]
MGYHGALEMYLHDHKFYTTQYLPAYTPLTTKEQVVLLLHGEQLVCGWAFLSYLRVERGVCGFVATDDPDVDQAGRPTPELTLRDGFPDGGSIEVTHVPGVPAASSF